LRVAAGYASRTSARRLHVGSGAPPAGGDRGRLSPTDKRCWRDGCRRGRPIGGTDIPRQTANRTRPQGACASDRPQAFGRRP
jgi:hypothetical protein